MAITDLLTRGATFDSEDVCVVRLTTSAWSGMRGTHLKKSLVVMRRMSRGYPLLVEECADVGAIAALAKVINLYEVCDGLYQVRICDVQQDWETGYIEDYNYKLIPFNKEPQA